MNASGKALGDERISRNSIVVSYERVTHRALLKSTADLRGLFLRRQISMTIHLPQCPSLLELGAWRRIEGRFAVNIFHEAQ